MPSSEYVLMTAKVVDRVGDRMLVHFAARRQIYYQKDGRGDVTYVGFFATNKAARAMWRAALRSEGVIA